MKFTYCLNNLVWCQTYFTPASGGLSPGSGCTGGCASGAAVAFRPVPVSDRQPKPERCLCLLKVKRKDTTKIATKCERYIARFKAAYVRCFHPKSKEMSSRASAAPSMAASAAQATVIWKEEGKKGRRNRYSSASAIVIFTPSVNWRPSTYL